MALHILNKSPWRSNDLQTCLRFCRDGDALLLIEDGVYAAIANSEWADRLATQLHLRFFALDADLEARGLKDRVAGFATVVDYDGFVELCAQNELIQSWF